MLVDPVKTRLFKEGDNLRDFIIEHIPKLTEASVLVITSKIVALSEGRIAEIREKEGIIKSESEVVVKTKWVWMTIVKGMCMASAGIDESNADGKIILLPKDSFATAVSLRSDLLMHYGIRKLGIVISDSRVPLMRAGSVGVALGYAGFAGLKDYDGKTDLFNRPLQLSKMNIADSFASAGVLVMGEGDEQQPLGIIQNSPATFIEKNNPTELLISMEDDIYAEFFRSGI